MSKKLFPCMLCEKRYAEIEEAEVCEQSHKAPIKVAPVTVAKDGGQAFPRSAGWNGLSHFEEHHANDEQSGMTLRDYFAAKALEGGMRAFLLDRTREVWDDYDDFAESCYRAAGAMLKARDKA